LSSALPSIVHTPGGDLYDLSLSSYWTQQEQSLKPACIVRPATANDVSETVKILEFFNRQEDGNYVEDSYSDSYAGCQFAIKSGGHTPFPGAANIDNGVTLDLSQLNQIDIETEAQTASIGPGCRWGEVYSTLQSKGYTVPGGRDSNVGVGGFVLGGGISFLSPRVGLVCNAVTNFEVVLASGEVVNANSTSNPQLFRALKGGSNNFGIVTKIDLPLTEPEMWGGFLYTDVALRQPAFDFFYEFAKSDAYDENAALIHSNVFFNGTWLLVLHMAYTQPAAVDPLIFEPLLNLPGHKTVRQTTHQNLAEELGAGVPVNKRGLWITITTKNSPSFMETLYQLGQETVDRIKGVEGVFFALSFQPLQQMMIQRAKANGGDAFGLDGVDDDLVIVNVGMLWENQGDDENMYSKAKEFFESATAQAKENGVWNEYQYLNYALRHESMTQTVIESYGKESLDQMRAASRQYDSAGLFQRAVPGGFKLW
jgi:FAD/FMN-containing dehydrogenase